MAGNQPNRDEGRNRVLQLFVMHRSSLFAFVISLVRDFSFAEEMMQEVAVVVCEQWSDFAPGTNFTAWARRIARNKIFNARAAGHLDVTFSPQAIDRIEQAAAIAETSPKPNRLRALQDCKARLNRKAIRIVTLYYQLGYDCKRIADEMQTSLQSIYTALSRIRSRLRHCIEAHLARETR